MKVISSIIFIMFYIIIISSCSQDEQYNLKEGDWRAVLTMEHENVIHYLPFNFTVSENTDGKKIIEIRNADEKLIADEIVYRKDSIIIKLPFFESEIVAVLRNDSLFGEYLHIRRNKTDRIPFQAAYGISGRFIATDEHGADVSGRWEVIFNEGTPKQHTAIGEFNQVGDFLTGTFLTPTGDYRYLEGKVAADKFMLSCFDGAHSLLFKADISGEGTLENGLLLGGSGWDETWRAFRNENITLPDPDTLTHLKEGYDKFDFSFKDMNGNMISPNDDKYKGKVALIQIIGSWCPNCMDETRLFAAYYKKYNSKGLEIIALCFESDDYEKSKKSIVRFKNHLNANYDFLYAGSAKKGRSEALPMIKRIYSFPTAIFIDRKGTVRKIHTGFLGPGTGKHYEDFVTKTTALIEELLNEESI